MAASQSLSQRSDVLNAINRCFLSCDEIHNREYVDDKLIADKRQNREDVHEECIAGLTLRRQQKEKALDFDETC